MPRRCLLALLLCPLLEAAIWPEQIGTLKRAETQNVAAPDPSLWSEFGFVTGERARFADAGRRLTATAWRLKDTTGAFAALESFGSSLPPGSTRIQEDNYVLQFEGGKLSADELKRLVNVLPKVDHASLPPLKDAIPAPGRIPGSERYIVGPVSLERFEPKISPSAAGFHLGAEAQLARYKSRQGEEQLIVFSYPTPQIARERSEILSRVAGAVVKRSGPLVAVVPSPGDSDAAERLLAMVKYTPIVTWSEPAPKKEANFGDILQSIVILAAVLIVCSVLLGVFLGGFRVLLARFGISSADDSFTALDIGKK